MEVRWATGFVSTDQPPAPALGPAPETSASTARPSPARSHAARGAMVTTADPEATYDALEQIYRHGPYAAARADWANLATGLSARREIRRVVQVLSRRTKNNPVLIGDPGVGKTAVVGGPAQRIRQRESLSLTGNAYVSLDPPVGDGVVPSTAAR